MSNIEKEVEEKRGDLEKPGELLKNISNYCKIFEKRKRNRNYSRDVLMDYQITRVIK